MTILFIITDNKVAAIRIEEEEEETYSKATWLIKHTKVTFVYPLKGRLDKTGEITHKRTNTSKWNVPRV